MNELYDFIIIGGGWYGCHIANILKEKYKIMIIEKSDDIFRKSSYYNQNRLHSGYHYCRNYDTRNLCKKYYERFFNTYPELIDNIENNYYSISKNSLIDFKTYKNIFLYENFEFVEVENNLFDNIDGNLIKVNEKVINSEKTHNYFKKKLKNVEIKYEETFINYKKNNDIINIKTNKNEYKCKIMLDCTYNQCELSKKKYMYEDTISLLFKKIKENNFDALTVMDGKFISLYPRDIKNNIYTLTDVENTPLTVDFHFNNEFKIDQYFLDDIKEKMIKKTKEYYKNFEEEFKYEGYFISKKTKMISYSDSRDITIEEITENVITVNCGKIYGIFDFEDYIKNKYML